MTKEIVKTGKILTIPLNANAIKLLGKKGEGQVNIENTLIYAKMLPSKLVSIPFCHYYRLTEGII